MEIAPKFFSMKIAFIFVGHQESSRVLDLVTPPLVKKMLHK